MGANNYRIIFDRTKSNALNIPIEIDWDFAGQEQSIELYQDDVIKKVIGNGYDFEVNRFPHDEDPLTKKTEINYEFYFYSGGSTANVSNWKMNYNLEGLTNEDIYYFTNNFTRSFFKLDFYDSVDEKRQTNYITVILPTTQGYKSSGILNNQTVNLKIPKFTLDFIGDKEGFFFYWLKELQFLNINTFYMTAKFYNASTGEFMKMMNTCQGSLNPSDYQNFDITKYFYYRVVFDYDKTCYRVYSFDPQTGAEQRVGTTTPIKWFEYLNP